VSAVNLSMLEDNDPDSPALVKFLHIRITSNKNQSQS